MKKLPRFHRGQRWSETSASGMNDAMSQAEMASKATGAGGITVGAGPGGITVKGSGYSRVATFELTEAVQWPDPTRTAGSASEPDVPWVENCRVVRYHPTEYTYQEFTDHAPTIYLPNCFRNDDGIGIGIARCGNNDRIIAGLSRQSGRWESLAPPLSVWRFELKDTLAPGGQATAYLLEDLSGTLTPNTNIEFEVYDRHSEFRGRARNAGVCAGSRGRARYFGDSQLWEIEKLQPHATMIRALVNEAGGVADTDATYNIDNVTIMQPVDTALFMSSDGTAPTEANNQADGELDNNAVVILGWNDEQEDWDTFVGPCPA